MGDQPNGDGSSTTLKTTEISLTLIRKIHELNGARLAQLVDELGLAKSTVYNHLSTLQENQFIIKEGNEYRLSLLFFLLGETTLKRKQEYVYAEEIIEELSDQTGLDADFNVEEHGQLISLYSDLPYSGPEPVFEQRIFRMHSTASGKAILAALPNQRVLEIIDRWGLPKKTEHTINSRSDLFDELEKISDRGYALSDEETVSGLQSIATVVTYPDGSVCGALSIDGPTYELRNDVLDENVHLLSEAQSKFESRISSLYT